MRAKRLNIPFTEGQARKTFHLVLEKSRKDHFRDACEDDIKTELWTRLK
jgi:hypothetical protein